MVDISRKNYEINGIETIGNDRVLRLNQKHIEEELDHKNLRVTTLKYLLNHRKHRYELIDEPKKQFYIIFIDRKLAIKEDMDCRATLANKFMTRLGFKQNDFILTKEQPVVTKTTS